MRQNVSDFNLVYLAVALGKRSASIAHKVTLNSITPKEQSELDGLIGRFGDWVSQCGWK